MNDQEFTDAIIAMTQTLYRVAYAQLARPEDRTDAVQEALRRAWERRHQLRQPQHLQTWLIRILLNVCHNMQLHQKRVFPMETLPERPPQESPDLSDALRALEEKQRLPLLLHYIEGYPIKEVARMLHLPEGTVKTRLTAGKKRLKELLQEEVFDP